jgi:hypothetical protein
MLNNSTLVDTMHAMFMLQNFVTSFFMCKYKHGKFWNFYYYNARNLYLILQLNYIYILTIINKFLCTN